MEPASAASSCFCKQLCQDESAPTVMKLARLLKSRTRDFETKLSQLSCEVVLGKSLIDVLDGTLKEKEMIIGDLQQKIKGGQSGWYGERDDYRAMVTQLQETRAAEAKENDSLRRDLRKASETITSIRESAAAAATPSSHPSSLSSLLSASAEQAAELESLRASLTLAHQTLAEKDKQLLALTSPPDPPAPRRPFHLLQGYYGGGGGA